MQQTVLIIGATSGLGKKLAELYCRHGDIVIAAGRRINLLNDLKDSYPLLLEVVFLDISSSTCYLNVQQLIERAGGIDILIVAASIGEFNNELLLDTELSMIKTNIEGFTCAINAAYHHFEKKNKGKIAGVTSVAAARGNKSAPAYSATKAFQSSYLESLRLKVKAEKKNIVITELIPGYMDTQMAKGDRLFWITSIDKSARQSYHAIAYGKKRAFISKRWYFIYKLYKFMPSLIYDYLMTSTIKLKKRT